MSDDPVAIVARTASLVRAGILPRGLTALEGAEELERIYARDDSLYGRLREAGIPEKPLHALTQIATLRESVRHTLHERRMGDELCLLLVLTMLPWWLQARVVASLTGKGSQGWCLTSRWGVPQ